jgi:hypothetical protein
MKKYSTLKFFSILWHSLFIQKYFPEETGNSVVYQVLSLTLILVNLIHILSHCIFIVDSDIPTPQP